MSTPSSSALVAATPSSVPSAQRAPPGRGAPPAGSRPGTRRPGRRARAPRSPGAAGRSARPPRRRAGTGRRPACERPRRPGRRAAGPPRRRPRAAPALRARRAPAVSGGSHSANAVDPRGDASSVTASTASPVSRQPEIAGLADRRRGEHECRVGPVRGADPAQPAQHVRHVRAEDAAVGVALVDHDVAQPAQERRPPRVRGQDPRCSMSGFVSTSRECARTQSRSARLGVAVEGGGADVRRAPAQRSGAQLVGRERLGRRQVERGRPWRRSSSVGEHREW